LRAKGSTSPRAGERRPRVRKSNRHSVFS
jgi:hypothetical protein